MQCKSLWIKASAKCINVNDVELSVCFKSTPAFNCELSTQSAFAKVPNAERFVCPTTLNEINVELSALSVTAQKPAFALLTPPVLSQENINASHVFHVNTVTAIETIHELAACSVPPRVSVDPSALPVIVCGPVYELSFCPVSVSEPLDDCFVFPATVPETVNALPVLSVSTLPRSRSMPWSSALSALAWWSSVPLWWSSAPPCWSSAQVWWSSAPPWWSSAQVWWSSAPLRWSSAQVWWSSAPLWRYSALSPLHWWTPVLSAPLWRSSAPHWWVPALSALHCWTPAPPWWAPVPSAPPWLPALPALPLSAATPLPRGPGPPSLPLFRLRSTALLDCIGASGSRSFGGGGYVTNLVYELPLTHHQRSLAHHMDSCTTLTVARHLRLQVPSSIALITQLT